MRMTCLAVGQGKTYSPCPDHCACRVTAPEIRNLDKVKVVRKCVDNDGVES